MEERLSSENTAGIVDTTSHIIDEIDELLEDFIEPEIMRLPQALYVMKRARDDIEKARESIRVAYSRVLASELLAFGQKAPIVCSRAPRDLIEAFNDTIAEASTLPEGRNKAHILSDFLDSARGDITQAQQHREEQDTAMMYLRCAMHSINDARQAMGKETLTSVICEDLPEITATNPEERLKQIHARIKGVQRRILQNLGGEYMTYWTKEWTELRKEEEAAVMDARIMCHDYSHL